MDKETLKKCLDLLSMDYYAHYPEMRHELGCAVMFDSPLGTICTCKKNMQAELDKWFEWARGEKHLHSLR